MSPTPMTDTEVPTQEILGGEVLLLPDEGVGYKVRLQVGRFTGVELRYGKVEFKEYGGTLKMSFTFEVLDRAGHSQLRTNRKFKSLISDLLRYLIVLEGNYDTSDWWDFSIKDY